MFTLKDVLVATDFGEAAETALNYGRELARRFGSKLHLIHVVDDLDARLSFVPGLPIDIGRLQVELETELRRQLEALLTEEDRRDLRAEAVLLASAMPASAITSYAKEHGIGLIVIGTHGRGPVAHLFIGSVAERVVRTSTCPVLTVHHPEREFVQPDALVRTTKA
jgi:nucleotide-binding universal stress UspA family protein